MLRSPLLYLLTVFAKLFLEDRILSHIWHVQCYTCICNHRIFGWEIRRSCDRIYFMVVRTHAKSPIRFLKVNTRRTPFTLTRFDKVIVWQILYISPEIFLFYRVHSVWVLFHRF